MASYPPRLATPMAPGTVCAWHFSIPSIPGVVEPRDQWCMCTVVRTVQLTDKSYVYTIRNTTRGARLFEARYTVTQNVPGADLVFVAPPPAEE